MSPYCDAGVSGAGGRGASGGAGRAPRQWGIHPPETSTAVRLEVGQGQQQLHDARTLVRHDDHPDTHPAGDVVFVVYMMGHVDQERDRQELTRRKQAN